MATRQRGNNDKRGGNAYNECVIRTDMVDSLENGGCCCCCVFLFLFLFFFFLLLLLLLLLPCEVTLLLVQLYSHRFVPDNMNKLWYTNQYLLINYWFKMWDEQYDMWTMNMGMAENCWSPKCTVKLLDLLNFAHLYTFPYLRSEQVASSESRDINTCTTKYQVFLQQHLLIFIVFCNTQLLRYCSYQLV